MIHIRSQVKTRQSQSYKSYKIAKNSHLKKLQKTLHTTHLLKLLDKMYKYEMDPTRTVGTTEQTRDAGRTDGQSETNIPPTTLMCGGIIISFSIRKITFKKISYLKPLVNSIRFSPIGWGGGGWGVGGTHRKSHYWHIAVLEVNYGISNTTVLEIL